MFHLPSRASLSRQHLPVTRSAQCLVTFHYPNFRHSFCAPRFLHLPSHHLHVSNTSQHITLQHTPTNMTRSHKYTDRDHAGLADGSAAAEEHLPRYFGKSGHADTDPNKLKKNGAGKGNWGHAGDELDDMGYNISNARRRSNSSSFTSKDFKTKFETIEPEPVFEEEIHGPLGNELDKQSTTSSSNTVDEEDASKK
ncbi:hypothetical protein P280DRAFT_547918 [Massarina eburnea CBS 473.64]|uniref:Hyaluronan/mRNA-binding protein domain-containing protein n=1 Tax=Massarina eburnea CBS 473.64 TaxID=1395130 RepID=A0A6A6S4C2_9PLEO|nr:hypothetical protein P280DRAFT_547918 [Massarina eburnea CBS 473.64]